MTDFCLNKHREFLLKPAEQIKVCLNSNKNDKRSTQVDIYANTLLLTKFVKEIR